MSITRAVMRPHPGHQTLPTPPPGPGTGEYDMCVLILQIYGLGYLANVCLQIVKLREREGQRVDLGRSLKGHLWMVDGGYPFPDALH